MSREEAIKQTGELMLHGWTLTNTHCGLCQSVLVSKAGRYHCPTCDGTMKFEVTPADVIMEIPSSLEEEKKEWDRSRKQRNEISSKLGERMLNGWTLLGESCPNEGCLGTTLVSKKSGPMFCVGCECSFVYDEVDDLIPESIPVTNINTSLTHEPPHTDAYTPLVDLNSAPFLEAPVDLDERVDFSSLISSKLLLGWAMLDETCNNTDCSGSVPLLRDKKRQKHCVECKQITSKDGVETHPTVAVSVPPAQFPTSVPAFQQQQQQQLPLPTQQAQEVASSPSRRLTSQCDVDEISEATRIVKQKILSVAKQLQESHDMGSSSRLAELLVKLAEAARAIELVLFLNHNLFISGTKQCPRARHQHTDI